MNSYCSRCPSIHHMIYKSVKHTIQRNRIKINVKQHCEHIEYVWTRTFNPTLINNNRCCMVIELNTQCVYNINHVSIVYWCRHIMNIELCVLISENIQQQQREKKQIKMKRRNAIITIETQSESPIATAHLKKSHNNNQIHVTWNKCL